jgi:hypothetical protein
MSTPISLEPTYQRCFRGAVPLFRQLRQGIGPVTPCTGPVTDDSYSSPAGPAQLQTALGRGPRRSVRGDSEEDGVRSQAGRDVVSAACSRSCDTSLRTVTVASAA